MSIQQQQQQQNHSIWNISMLALSIGTSNEKLLYAIFPLAISHIESKQPTKQANKKL